MPGVKGNAVIGQSGGPTAVINRSFTGAISEARKHAEITELYGARHGIQGMLNNEYVPLFEQPNFVLQQISKTPAAALGSIRHKPTREECKKIFNNFKQMNVRYFFYIGGNDSAETAYIINSFAAEENYDLRVVHIPKTIDNDLLVTDHCPGYGSAARFVACAFIGDNEDNRALKGVKINVVMGRNAGFLTAASLLARQYPKDGPHLIYIPELPFDLDTFLDEIDRTFKEHGRALIAISEGINKQGVFNIKEGEKPEYISNWLNSMVSLDLPDKYLPKEKGKIVEVDSHGNVSLSGSSMMGDILATIVKSTLSIKRVRADTLGYPQRSFPLAISEVDADEAYRVGVDAVISATQTNFDEGSIAIRRIDEGGKYEIETFISPLQSVQRQTKSFPKEWITDDGIIDERQFREYVNPLVGELPMAGRFVRAIF
ncbi:MAG: diphosphate--fructose-6-phosphate 1-phosphotransferase [Spirochaetota bacterium]|nr:MAG: diphosphate--fructose-6-phosphate 1-phosphotransferase [Spirochaetota bacterium]